MYWGMFTNQSWTWSILAPLGTDTNLRTNWALSRCECIGAAEFGFCGPPPMAWPDTAPCIICPNSVTCGIVPPFGALRRFKISLLSEHTRLGTKYWATVIWCKNSSAIYFFSHASRACDTSKTVTICAGATPDALINTVAMRSDRATPLASTIMTSGRTTRSAACGAAASRLSPIEQQAQPLDNSIVFSYYYQLDARRYSPF